MEDDKVNGIAALLIGAVVAYIVNGFLGEGAIKRIISLAIGFVVMVFVASM